MAIEAEKEVEDTPLPTKTFSSIATALAESTENWLTKARKKKVCVTVHGEKESSGILEGVPRRVRDFWDISVSRLVETTTVDQVKRHLQESGIEVKEVYVFPSKIKGTKSAKVRVVLQHKERVKDAQLWPKHSRVQDWLYKPKGERQAKLGSENGRK